MLINNSKKQNKQLENERRIAAYDRVKKLHEDAGFLCYIDDAYMEKYNGKESMKLEGVVAKGIGLVTEQYSLYSCEGVFKANITIEEMYVGTNAVKQLEGGDKRVALYPVEQEIAYHAGDILCKLQEE